LKHKDPVFTGGILFYKYSSIHLLILNMKDNFSKQSDTYAKYRPVYPQELFDCITGFVPSKKLVWDCGTGNGQTAAVLCKYFEKVYATDISKNQIDNAVQAANIIYALEPAEQTSLEDNSVDLVTVSQALHWFDFEKFYGEVKRVSKKKGIIAAWTYNLLQIDPITDKIIHHYHFDTLETYWDKERAHVNDNYANIPFPFDPIVTPHFSIKVKWNVEDLEGYLNTWSALQKFISLNNFNPVDGLIEKIKENWPSEEIRPVEFPLTIKIGYVH
jgi:ubiquinone/menaquinone biosynthesis C-methylase UbiE